MIPFTKMQGVGNDFVVLDGVRHTIHLTPALIQRMGDRHFGIGFDQLLLIEPATQNTADFVYRIFNADGNEVGQCGNGARCVGRFLLDTGLVPPTRSPILLSTQERILEIHPRAHNQIAVNMGVPLFDPPKIPFHLFAEVTQLDKGPYEIKLDHEAVQFSVVSMGNPHAVLLVEDVSTAPVAQLGEKLGHHPCFPEGVNIGFMQRLNHREIRLRVYERGAGETLACGSGASAAVVVGCMQGLLDTEVQVHLLGGTLTVNWLGEGQPVWMAGPAEVVFKGEWTEHA